MKSTRFSAARVVFRSIVAAVLLALIAASNTGCGQRGPLYLPDAEPGGEGPAAAADRGAKPDSPDGGRSDEPPDSEDSE